MRINSDFVIGRSPPSKVVVPEQTGPMAARMDARDHRGNTGLGIKVGLRETPSEAAKVLRIAPGFGVIDLIATT